MRKTFTLATLVRVTTRSLRSFVCDRRCGCVCVCVRGRRCSRLPSPSPTPHPLFAPDVSIRPPTSEAPPKAEPRTASIRVSVTRIRIFSTPLCALQPSPLVPISSAQRPEPFDPGVFLGVSRLCKLVATSHRLFLRSVVERIL